MFTNSRDHAPHHPARLIPQRNAIRWNPMSDVISDYQRWKLQGETLRAKAREAMQARFRDQLMASTMWAACPTSRQLK
jgi:hypothetical protein